MRKFMCGAFIALAGVMSLVSLPARSQAQGFGGGEIERALRPGVYVPYDGAGFSHRYNYEIGPAFYFNYNGGNIAHLDYLDRLDRAENFGHRWPSSKHGQEYQIERIHREYWHNAHRFGSGRHIIIKQEVSCSPAPERAEPASKLQSEPQLESIKTPPGESVPSK